MMKSKCDCPSQVRSGEHSVGLLPLHRLRQLADSFGLWQHPRPRPLPSTSGLHSLIHFVCRCRRRRLRLPVALQLSGRGAYWTNVSVALLPFHLWQALCWSSVGETEWFWFCSVFSVKSSEESLRIILCCCQQNKS